MDNNKQQEEEEYYIGVDVGTSSVRACLMCVSGRTQDAHTGKVKVENTYIQKTHTHPITVYNPKKDYYEQDSEEIWRAVCVCVQEVSCGVRKKDKIYGLGFDATCSLVLLDKDFKPVGVNPEAEDHRNIIMWMDHRATKEVDHINSHPHSVLKYIGGVMSVEMEAAKLLWLKVHHSSAYHRTQHFLDLPDYLTYRATHSTTRSLCSLVCKWTYVNSEDQSGGWDEEFFRLIGLGDLADEKWARIGQTVKPPGEKCGNLTHTAAHMMGLHVHIPVCTSMIDAHAGVLSLAAAGLVEGQPITGRLGLVCGTSTCHMVLSGSPYTVPGVWGPYRGAVFPGVYLCEGGMSASGALVDHIIRSHPADLSADLSAEGRSVYEVLEGVLEVEAQREGLTHPSLLTPSLHVYPDYHGNRSPLADPYMTGMISGLTLDKSKENLALLYLATLQALAYGTRQILGHMRSSGHAISHVVMCGGLCASKTFIQTHADVLGVEVLVPTTQPSVLVGAAILGAGAGGRFGSLEGAARCLSGPADVYRPTEQLHGYHEKKYKIFLEMQQQQKRFREIMDA